MVGSMVPLRWEICGVRGENLEISGGLFAALSSWTLRLLQLNNGWVRSDVPTKRTVLLRKELKLQPPALMLLSDLGHVFSLDWKQYIRGLDPEAVIETESKTSPL
ncbi:hypothetical protein EYF80_055287 [Liparis tanakae]|uniref:Uncharacterized protein n=1 Tax=Liparis tanakae TaxID=230148 RepID=A0A4Z2F105_9TELE|nr:hypothetical protein EYF80_055287 [Liparis tanakae]